MHEGITKAVILIGELKKNWEMLDDNVKQAIHIYEWQGARWDSVHAFEQENYHDIAEAINNEIEGR
jgi:hypothetical protein